MYVDLNSHKRALLVPSRVMAVGQGLCGAPLGSAGASPPPGMQEKSCHKRVFALVSSVEKRLLRAQFRAVKLTPTS